MIQAAEVKRVPQDQNDVGPIQAEESFISYPVLDNYGHGTHIAGIILEIAPQADIYVAKVAHEKVVNDIDHFVKVHRPHKTNI